MRGKVSVQVHATGVQPRASLESVGIQERKHNDPLAAEETAVLCQMSSKALEKWRAQRFVAVNYPDKKAGLLAGTQHPSLDGFPLAGVTEYF